MFLGSYWYHFVCETMSADACKNGLFFVFSGTIHSSVSSLICSAYPNLHKKIFIFKPSLSNLC